MNTKEQTHFRAGVWAALIGLVFLIGMYKFPREYPDLSLLESFYYTLRLFILEHDLPRFPKSGSLIFIYFLAPVLSVSALGTAINYLFRLSPVIQSKWHSDHVIVCGVGRTGKLVAETFKNKGIKVIGVDNGTPESFDEWKVRANIPIIFGDFLSRLVLDRAGAPAARAVIFASGDDLLNLEGVISAYDWLRNSQGPIRLLWAHIASEKLADTARIALRTEGLVGIRFFDTYRIAAQKMIAKHFAQDTRARIREITLLGFGKFGRDLMEVLVQSFTSDEFHTLRVVDIQDRSKEVRTLARELGVSDRVTFLQTDINDLTLSDDQEKAFFLCTDDDIGNLAVALTLTKEVRGTHVYVRMAKWPLWAIENHLQENRGITFININDLVVEGILDLPGILEPAQAADLKRSYKNP
jgi:hypothetical protein